ncbi:helix-turn-helix domain-containing protein [Limnobacter humi]|uniref:Helix-turn-helix domain-containing protein n=1 Tax=Limnobacter humi TaxID=1778671 RepID=A0ABT1WJI4_9BURK|nr:helix-turn-helix domain-containing protein [Limnobacter humi]MCQ8897676.1 helix-turn-helix domain-containing protein [Limnobacter humi]
MAYIDIFKSFSATVFSMIIGLLLYPGCMPAGLLSFNDLLQAANRLARKPLFETVWVGTRLEAVAYGNGVSLQPNALLNNTELDALLIPGLWTESPTDMAQALAQQAELIDQLRTLPAPIQLWSYCTGVCLAAASGRLNQHAATATWWLAEFVERKYPKVRWHVDSDCILTPKVGTAAGVHGYLMLAQELVRTHLKTPVFQEFMRLMVLPRPVQHHPAFRSFAFMEQADPLLRQLAELVAKTPAETITVQALATQLNLSERTLARKVRDLTNTPVATYARLLKLHQVSEQLIWSSLPVSSISSNLGYSNESNLRRQFKQVTGLSPFQYRRQYARR